LNSETLIKLLLEEAKKFSQFLANFLRSPFWALELNGYYRGYIGNHTTGIKQKKLIPELTS